MAPLAVVIVTSSSTPNFARNELSKDTVDSYSTNNAPKSPFSVNTLFGSVCSLFSEYIIPSGALGFDSKITSPLFGVRTKRAVNDEQEPVESDFLGKGEKINIHLPERDDKVVLIERFISSVEKMDEKSLDRVIDIVLLRLNNDNIVSISKSEIKEAISFIVNNPDLAKNYYANEIEKSDIVYDTIGGGNPLLCIIEWILSRFIFYFLLLVLCVQIFLSMAPASLCNCMTFVC